MDLITIARYHSSENYFYIINSFNIFFIVFRLILNERLSQNTTLKNTVMISFIIIIDVKHNVNKNNYISR